MITQSYHLPLSCLLKPWWVLSPCFGEWTIHISLMHTAMDTPF